MRGMATLPKVIRRQSWKTPGKLGVSKSMECDIFPSVFWYCWLNDRKGIRPVKKLGVGWWWWFGWGFARLIVPVVQLSPPPPSSFASINTGLNPGSTENGHYNGQRERESSSSSITDHSFSYSQLRNTSRQLTTGWLEVEAVTADISGWSADTGGTGRLAVASALLVRMSGAAGTVATDLTAVHSSERRPSIKEKRCIPGLVCWCLTALSAQIGYIVP